MNGKKILIASCYKDKLATFAGYIKDKGFDILTATDGAAVLEIALNDRPSVVVIDIVLPVIDGERVFQILHNNPHTAEIPFIFIGHEAKDIKGFRRGVDFLFLQPVKVEEIFRRINDDFRSPQSLRSAHARAQEIEGRLS